MTVMLTKAGMQSAMVHHIMVLGCSATLGMVAPHSRESSSDDERERRSTRTWPTVPYSCTRFQGTTGAQYTTPLLMLVHSCTSSNPLLTSASGRARVLTR